MATKPKSVDSYIAHAPAEVRAKLRELRAAIKKAAPLAQEKISYGMPSYLYLGRLTYFRHWKAHIGLYLPGSVVADFADELKSYETSKATVRLPLKRKIPLLLVRRLIQAAVKKNETKKAKRR